MFRVQQEGCGLTSSTRGWSWGAGWRTCLPLSLQQPSFSSWARGPRAQSSSRRTCRTQHRVVLRTRIYYSERMQSKVSTGKGTGGRICQSPDSSPCGVSRTRFIPSALTHDMFEVSSTTEAHQTEHPRLIKTLSSRLPEKTRCSA